MPALSVPLMPALSVSVDGALLATVNADDCEMLHIVVSTTALNDEIAALTVLGGVFPEDGQYSVLLWVNKQSVQPGQTVEVSLLATGITSHRGKTVKELFPDEPPPGQSDFQLTTEFFADIRSRYPTLRKKHAFRVVAANGVVSEHETAPDDIGSSFALRWNSVCPEDASVTLHSYTADDLESDRPVNCYFEQEIHIGDLVRFQLVA